MVAEEEKWMGIRPTRPEKFHSWRECLVILSDPGAAALDKTVGMYVCSMESQVVCGGPCASLSLSYEDGWRRSDEEDEAYLPPPSTQQTGPHT